MTKLLTNAKTVLSNSRMLNSYSQWISHKAIGLDPKIKIPYGGNIGHLRHFSEYWSVTNNIYNMELDREQKLVQRLLIDGGIAFDIGANVGVFSTMISTSSQKALIYSFEPLLSTFSILKSNIQDNSLNNVICENIALSDICGEIKFTAKEGSPSQNKICNSTENNLEITSVASMTLDAYCAENNIDLIKFVKIDVEGAELLVLKGAQQMLQQQKIDALLIEVIPHAITNMGLEISELVNFINDMGYECHYLNDDGTVGKSISLEEMKNFTLENIFLVPHK